LLFGYGVEYKEFDSATKTITINRYPANQWAFLWDTDANLSAAVRCVSMAANTVHEGEILASATDLLWIYTEEEYGQFIRSVDGGGEWKGEIKTNDLKLIPIVVWLADEEMHGIISDALLAMNDAYNEEFNLEGDDISNTVDCLLKLWGVDSAWATANEAAIRDKRMLSFDRKKEEQDAEYLRRELNIEPHIKHLKTTRENIHIMGSIPDVAEITGATGSTSGIALKLAFTPMQQAFEAYAPFEKENIYTRIDLLNARLKLLSQPTIDNAEVDIQFRIPTNRIEEWQNIEKLKGVVSHETQLSLLTDIEDPAEELQKVVDEMGEDQPAILATRVAENEARAANLERLLVESDARTSEAIGAMITGNEALVTKLIDAIKAKA
jgi:SPP1 family phage portal protein